MMTTRDAVTSQFPFQGSGCMGIGLVASMNRFFDDLFSASLGFFDNRQIQFLSPLGGICQYSKDISRLNVDKASRNRDFFFNPPMNNPNDTWDKHSDQRDVMHQDRNLPLT